MRGFRSFGSYKSRDPFGPWIGTIASNYCIDVLRKRRRQKEPLQSAESADENNLVAPDGRMVYRA